jgi:hypothetical protein
VHHKSYPICKSHSTHAGQTISRYLSEGILLVVECEVPLCWRGASLQFGLSYGPSPAMKLASPVGEGANHFHYRGRRGFRRCTHYAVRSRGKEMASRDTERTAYRCWYRDRSMRHQVDQTHRTSMSSDDQVVATQGSDLHHQDQRHRGYIRRWDGLV